MNKKILLGVGTALVLGAALPCSAASLPSVSAPAQVPALPAVTSASTALPALPAVAAASPTTSGGLGRAVNRRQTLPGLDGLDSGAKPAGARVLSIRPIRVPPDVLPTPPVSLP